MKNKLYLYIGQCESFSVDGMFIIYGKRDPSSDYIAGIRVASCANHENNLGDFSNKWHISCFKEVDKIPDWMTMFKPDDKIAKHALSMEYIAVDFYNKFC